MTVTIGNVLRLPALQGASLLTDARGLEMPVTAVSVLEYSEVTAIQKSLVDQIHYQGNELVLTAFANVRDNVTAQCENIRLMKSQGDTGLVLFYVGILMPKVDQMLIDLANELDYALILMPMNDPHPAYSDVIGDVMQSIFLDQMHNPMFAMQLLEQVTKMPVQHHSIDTVVRLISERLHVGIALFDQDGQELVSCAWPATVNENWLNFSRAHFEGISGLIDSRQQYWEQVTDNQHFGTVSLLILRDGPAMDVYARSEVVSALQIALNLWGKNPGAINRSALLTAIMADDPLRIHKLSRFFHVSVNELQHVWIIPQFVGQESSHHKEQLVDEVSRFATVSLCERYKDMLFICVNGALSARLIAHISKSITDLTALWNYPVSPIVCPHLLGLSDLRSATELVQTNAADAAMIFPHDECLTIGELRLAQKCCNMIARGTTWLNSVLNAQRRLIDVDEAPELLETIAAFLLDCNCSVVDTARQLFVHPNTVKYRLGKIENLVGFKVGTMPDSEWLYTLAGISRLMQ